MIREITGHGAFLTAGGRADDGKPSQPKEKVAERSVQIAIEEPKAQSVRTPDVSAQDSVPNVGHELRYEVEEDLNKVVVKILDGDSGELVRQIPAEEVVRLAKVLEWTNGQLLDRKV